MLTCLSLAEPIPKEPLSTLPVPVVTELVVGYLYNLYAEPDCKLIKICEKKYTVQIQYRYLFNRTSFDNTFICS